MPKSQVQADSHLKLTDDDYIHWAQRSRWTVNEAVSLLHGELPERGYSVVELIEKFPDTRRLLESRWGYDDFYEAPEMWVQQASRAAVRINKGWEAKFPYRIKRRQIQPNEPDFKDFVDCFVRNVESPLRDLVDYALGERFEWPNKIPKRASSLLKRIHGELPKGNRVHMGTEMGDVVVKPAWFFDTCLQLDIDLDPRCKSWVKWIEAYPKYVVWLKGSAPKRNNADRIPSSKEQDAHEDVKYELSEDNTITKREAAERANKNNPLKYRDTSVETLLRYDRAVRRYDNN